MNTARIYYFTGTGNSLAVARELASRINAELIGIPAAVKSGTEIPEGVVVGVVYPLYAGGLPNIVARFLEGVSFRNAEYLFFVATEGGRMGTPAAQISRLTKAAGHAADASWWLQMPDNYIPLSAPPEKEEQKRLYAEADKKIAGIANAVIARGKQIEKMGFAGKLMSAAYGPFIRSLPASDKKFTVSPNCSECGICETVCPVDNIRAGEHGDRIWLHHCEGCLACLHFCPDEAINIGKKTELRARYHHPSVTVSDMKQQKEG